jgi:xanthosine utilization system XapX-like protein
MNPGWLRGADLLAGAAGVLLIVSLFLPWLGGRTGWEAFSVDDILLALFGAVGVGLVLSIMTRRSPVLPISLAIVGTVVGIVAVVIVVVRILGGDDLGVGAWLSLAGALGLPAGAFRSMADERNRGVAPVSSELRPAP